MINLKVNSTMDGRCLNGHTWTYTGSLRFDLEGYPCDCGEVLYHNEPCECCGTPKLKPIPNKHKGGEQ